MNITKITPSREAKQRVLNKSFLIFRPDDLPQLLRPIKVNVKNTCALTGEPIYQGDYAYPCHINPIRLTPHGTARVLIDAALKKGNAILPAGYYAFKVPTFEELNSRGAVKIADKKRNDLLTGEVRKVLGVK